MPVSKISDSGTCWSKRGRSRWMGSKRMLGTGPPPSIGSPSRLTRGPAPLRPPGSGSAARVLHRHAARQPAGGRHGDAAHDVVAEMLLDFERRCSSRLLHPGRVTQLYTRAACRHRTRRPPRDHHMHHSSDRHGLLPGPSADQLQHLRCNRLLAGAPVLPEQLVEHFPRILRGPVHGHLARRVLGRHAAQERYFSASAARIRGAGGAAFPPRPAPGTAWRSPRPAGTARAPRASLRPPAGARRRTS